MRRGRWTKLAICAIILLGLRGQVSWAGPKGPPPPKQPVEEKYLLITAVGKHENAEGAHDNALDDARDQILALLQQQSPPVVWPGQKAFVEEHLHNGKWLVHEAQTENIGSASQALVRSTLTVELRVSEYQEMLHLDRVWRAEQRQFWLAKLLPGLVIILTGVAGYSRVRRTPRVRKAGSKGLVKLAGVALIILVLAGLASSAFRFVSPTPPPPPSEATTVDR